jgi:nitroimidazol reductase NimA-like FMN-containing flavoprotein (pyridoxamine 5'-phosphate oxidase superfamily)
MVEQSLRPQRRSRRVAMTEAERDAFLESERVCRVATAGPHGPHATPLWYVWHDSSIWLYSIVRSQRWADLTADPRIGVVVDGGVEYAELRGVEITGRVEIVGEVPRTGEPNDTLALVEAAMARRYHDGPDQTFELDGRHAWLQVIAEKIVSWDFRKISS